MKAIAGAVSSPLSTVDATTTTVFTNDPLTAGTVIQGTHVLELRTAVNAMRAAAGLTAQAFTDSPSLAGIRVKAIHLQQLRTALDQARSAIGLPALVYTDPTITTGSTKVKTTHFTSLRTGVK